MNILVFGSEGILGREMMKSFPNAFGTRMSGHGPLDGIDISNAAHIERAFTVSRAHVAINCAGIVKSECEKHPIDQVLSVNAEAPHKIADVAKHFGARVIHFSTDCVFDGSRGERTEDEHPDATDMYGRSKALGETTSYPCVTIRTSFVGWDPARQRGLLEWLSRSAGSVPGYSAVRWSGLSAPELARVTRRIIDHGSVCGLYHVSGPSISKADLLEAIVNTLGLKCEVVRTDAVRADMTLNSGKFERTFGYRPPTWATMAKELVQCS